MSRGALKGVERKSFHGCGGDCRSLLPCQSKYTIKGDELTTDSLTSIGLDLRKSQNGSYAGANSACISRLVDMVRTSEQILEVSPLRPLIVCIVLMSMNIDGYQWVREQSHRLVGVASSKDGTR